MSKPLAFGSIKKGGGVAKIFTAGLHYSCPLPNGYTIKSDTRIRKITMEQNQDLPTAKGLHVGELFSQTRTYNIPQFQRGYAWDLNDIDDLLRDFEKAFIDRPNEPYLLGQIILCQDKDSQRLSVIDGQQRLTSLFLFLIAANQELDRRGDLEDFQISRKTLISLAIVNSTKNKSEPRLLVTENAQEIMSQILENKLTKSSKTKNYSEENIKEAYFRFRSYLESDYPDTSDLFEFVIFVFYHVYVLELRLSSVTEAVRVFASMNNRGKGLVDSDLIKNLLFAVVSDDESYKGMAADWDFAAEALYKAKYKRLRSMDYLLKLLIGIETGVSIRSEELFEEWQKILESESEVRDFAAGLPANAKVLKLLSLGKTPENESSPEVFGSQQFNISQHFEVLMAGRKLTSDSFVELSRIVDARMMLFLFSAEKPQDFERIVHPWAKSISELNATATREEIIEASMNVLEHKMLNSLIKKMKEEFNELSYSVSSQRKRIRYIIARCERTLQSKFLQKTNWSLEDMNSTKGDSGWHLDHIFPQAQINDFPQAGLKQITKPEAINLLGNLMLFSPRDNRTMKDAHPSSKEKQSYIAGSLVFLNATLIDETLWSETHKTNQKDKEVLLRIQGPVAPLSKTWNIESIRARQQVYFELFASSILTDLGSSLDIVDFD